MIVILVKNIIFLNYFDCILIYNLIIYRIFLLRKLFENANKELFICNLKVWKKFNSK